MSPDQIARMRSNLADMRSKLAEVRAGLDQLKAREPERLRRRIKSEMALEQLHRANIALRDALPH
jgi:phage shock protein A